MLKFVEDILETNWSHYEFAAVDKTQTADQPFVICRFAILPVILTSIPDLQMVLEEKDSKAATLTFLMGCQQQSASPVTISRFSS
jgi:hypothetical protein